MTDNKVLDSVMRYGIRYNGSGTAEVKVPEDKGHLELIETSPEGKVYRHIVIGCLDDVNKIPNWSVQVVSND